jgi:hypothetical protein
MPKKSRRMSPAPALNKRRTYFPSRSFDDDLAALVDLYERYEWAFSGVDLATLREDARRQRAERLAHDAAEADWLKTNREFGMRTEARHQRYSAALDAPRGAFKNDKAVMAQLDKFKRARVRRPSKVVAVPVVGPKKA